MSIIGSNILAGASGQAGGGYEIEQSLRFNSADSAYLNRTPGSAGNRKAWTISFWHKRSKITDSAIQTIWGAGTVSSSGDIITFDTDDVFRVWFESNTYNIETSQVFRDISAWGHWVVSVDTTQATASDRVKIYYNGSQITAFSTASYPPQNYDTAINNTTLHRFGFTANGDYNYLNGYLAEVNFIDGSALDHEDFGQLDNNGVWRPIKYAGSYTGNSFYLKFASGDGTDSSGLSNTWTANNFTTSGTGTDVMSDTPTNNYATFNPVNTTAVTSSATTLDNGNLDVAFNASANNYSSYLTHGITSGKYYFEITCNSSTTSASNVGFVGDNNLEAKRNATASAVPGQHGTYGRGVDGAGTLYNGSGGSDGSYMAAWGQGDIIMVAIDADNEKFYLGANGKWADGSGNTDQSTLTSGAEISLSASTTPYLFGVGDSSSSVAADFTLNAGQREFAYPPGTASATDYFNCVTYTGNGSTKSITGVGFQPDFVWIKKRDTDGNHMLTDVVRGANTEINSNTSAEEIANTNALTSFDTDGFSVGADGAVNSNGEGLVAWCWKAGGAASSNTDGTIASSVSANQDAGFSIVSYTGTGTAGTIGHDLNVAPSFYIVKNRDGAYFWPCYHASLTNPATTYIGLNESLGQQTAETHWNSTAPTSTVFSVNTQLSVNNSGDKYVAYCFAEKTGISKFGSFTGNGSSTGPFVECGFKPRLVIVKRTDAASNWFMYDTIRGTNNKLYADSVQEDNGEDGGSTTSNTILSLSTGFQMTSGNGSNANGGTYIFMAWAENFSADADFKSLNTANLPAPDIADGSDYFQAVTYNGTGSSQDITVADNSGNSWQPDLVWMKVRNDALSHHLNDAVRGAGERLQSNTTQAEETKTDALTSFNPDGFTVISSGETNQSGKTYVAWNWLAANGTEVLDTGSIDSTVSANPSAGFSIVNWTVGSTDNQTVGHGLGVPPDLIITKNRDTAYGWATYHSPLGATKYLTLDTTNSAATNSIAWNNTEPTSTVFTVGDASWWGSSTDSMIAYCFAEVESYSKIGSYTGNGSSDGPFIATSFTPSWVMLKRTDSAGTDWIIQDAARSPYNVVDDILRANTDQAEASGNTNYYIDFLSNGIKLRTTSGAWNASGGTYVFMCFAENPFGGSGVSPATAR
jgi:hypothetical protein